MGLQNKVIHSMAWSSIGQFIALSISFISNMILARLLSPEDYGCIGMLTIFLAISYSFVNGGFGLALIQKKNATHIDYSTIFYWNLSVSILCVIILFFAAPHIAEFYNIPLLKNVLRVLSIELILTALAIVPTNQLKKTFKFKLLAQRTIASSSIATIVTIAMAYNGFGVWSLVAHNLVKAFVILIMLWRMTDWRPTLEFSFRSWKEMFSFGGMMFLSSLLDTVYKNVNGLVIGKMFSSRDMGYFAQARKLEEVPSLSLTAVVNEVSFSTFSSIQDQKTSLLNALKKNCSALSFLCFPLFFLMIVLGPVIIPILFGEKWIPAVPYFQILCLGSMLMTLNSVYESVIKALGKGKLFFATFSFNRIIGLVSIFVGSRYGINGILTGIVIATYIGLSVNMTVSRKIVDYRFCDQFRNLLPSYIISIICCATTYFLVARLITNRFIYLFVAITVFALLYLIISRLLKVEGFSLVFDIIKQKLHGRNKRQA